MSGGLEDFLALAGGGRQVLVDHGGGAVPVVVRGVSLHGLALLLPRFPEVGRLVEGDRVDAAALLSLAPRAVAAVIAAGVGAPGEARAEAVAAALPISAQVALLEAVIAETLPDGLGEFLARLRRLAAGLGVAVPVVGGEGAASGPPSPPPPSG